MSDWLPWLIAAAAAITAWLGLRKRGSKAAEDALVAEARRREAEAAEAGRRAERHGQDADEAAQEAEDAMERADAARDRGVRDSGDDAERLARHRDAVERARRRRPR